MRGALAILILLTCASGAIWSADARSRANSETVCWSHDLSRAHRLSRESGKPILWVKDDPPARTLLAGPFSHPIVVDASNELFIPLFMTDGAPSSPLVRFEDADAHALTPRASADVTTAAVLAQMAAALRSAHRNVPAYLQLAADEYNPAAPQTASFAVGCYWEGEREIGSLDGIVATRTGTLGGDEVVQVEFDAARVEYAALLRKVGSMRCFRSAVAPGDARLEPSEVQQFTLFQSPEYWYLPLTALQATRINAALSQRCDPDVDKFLSPPQRAMRAELHAIVSRSGDEPLKRLKVDRSLEGLANYCQSVRRTIAQLGAADF